MPQITLPYGAGKTICTTELKAHMSIAGNNPMVIGGQSVIFEEHTKPESLDYWIRSRIDTYSNTRQATKELIASLCDTGIFEECTVPSSNPKGRRTIKAIKLSESVGESTTVNPAISGGGGPYEINTDDDYVRYSAANICAFIEKNGPFTEQFLWSWETSDSIAVVLEGIDAGRKSGAEDALKLRKAARRKLCDDPTDAEKALVFAHFVQDFGGVKSKNSFNNKAEWAFNVYSEKGADTAKNIRLSGISTISKCLTLLDEDLPIYDARVSYSINAINWLQGRHDLFLPSPPGRNASLGILDIRTLYLIENAGTLTEVTACLEAGGGRRASQALNKFSLPKDSTYEIYCRILSKVKNDLKAPHTRSIDEIEMALFASAPYVLLLQVLKALSSNSQQLAA